MDINGNQVIAVDFDGTLCKQAWPEIGEENEILIEHLKEQQAAGARLILWTNREGDLLEEAVEWCKARGLTFDTVNANLPELIDLYKNDCRKINNKAVYLVRDGVKQEINEYLDEDSDFIQLQHGTNTIRYTADAGEDYLNVTVSYRFRYLGV